MELSSRSRQYAFSGVRAVFEKALQYKDTINFGIGEPGFATGRNVIDATYAAMNNGATKYVSNAGLQPLREAIVAKYRKEQGIECAPANVHVFNGATHALLMAMLCTMDPGDEILIPCPYYAAYIGMADVACVGIVDVPVYEKDKFHVKAENLEKCLTPKTKAILINSPSNPLGSVTPAEDLKQIAEFAIAHDLWVIADEPYEALLYDGAKHVCLGSFPGMAERTVICNSVSKTYAMAGFRIGYCVAPEEMCMQMTRVQSSMISSVAAPMQYAALEALTGPQDYVAEMVAEYDKRRKIMVEGLNRLKGFSCLAPEGAFYTFPNVTETGMNDRDLAFYLLENTGVVTVPGSAFGKYGEGYLRVSYCTETEKIVEGLDRMARLLGTK
ncbi:MAG: pyridoxal phosphate-dependent aminotransferase [Firmicutes bacterium]|nr:pyridoxal phosphate-dependent aminotransferase [Bacillota bacterium]MBR0050530.1 pyridoxal phosphate-dependent aminotransferase [Bacillota bacterium]MBR3034568.1 pyridoxal phosphate-dependent aminotransferase [Bacillota bacterium]